MLPSIGPGDKACNLFNGTWIRDFRGPVYTNITCPTMPESRNCGKYGKQMDYVNWKWSPHGCDMVRFEPQLFLNIVQGKTLAFAADSIGRNQMESLLCLLRGDNTPTSKVSLISQSLIVLAPVSLNIVAKTPLRVGHQSMCCIVRAFVLTIAVYDSSNNKITP